MRDMLIGVGLAIVLVALVLSIRMKLRPEGCDAGHEGDERAISTDNGSVIETCTALHRADKSVYGYDWAKR